MDLRTFLFKHGFTVYEFSRRVGIDKHYAFCLVRRRNRPGSSLCQIIEYVTRGNVTVDELINPCEYAVDWAGDKAPKTPRRIINIKPVDPSKLKEYTPYNVRKAKNGQTHQPRKARCEQGKQEESAEGHQGVAEGRQDV